MEFINQETGSPATGTPAGEPQQQPVQPSEMPTSEPQMPAAPQEGQPGGDAPQGN